MVEGHGPATHPNPRNRRRPRADLRLQRSVRRPPGRGDDRGERAERRLGRGPASELPRAAAGARPAAQRDGRAPHPRLLARAERTLWGSGGGAVVAGGRRRAQPGAAARRGPDRSDPARPAGRRRGAASRARRAAELDAGEAREWRVRGFRRRAGHRSERLPVAELRRSRSRAAGRPREDPAALRPADRRALHAGARPRLRPERLQHRAAPGTARDPHGRSRRHEARAEPLHHGLDRPGCAALTAGAVGRARRHPRRAQGAAPRRRRARGAVAPRRDPAPARRRAGRRRDR